MERNKGGHFKRKKFDNIVFGRQPVVELLQSDKEVDTLYIQQGATGVIIQEMIRLAQSRHIPVKQVPAEKLSRFTGGNHQGVIAFTTDIAFEHIEDVLPFIIEKGEVPLLLILDGITDVGNFGAIARTAYGAGVHAIVIMAQHAAPVNGDAIKASAGALNNMTICREKNLDQVLQFLILNGMQIIGLDAQATTPVFQVDLTLPTALVMGSEDTGISSSARKFISHTVHIPMQNAFDSYNVSVATGMVLYEVMRQRREIK
ncbi:MAG: 23S rRNA (guanosine(2251)-2'-O)-methyltransferase RlmB [Chitinophagales bacterium]